MAEKKRAASKVGRARAQMYRDLVLESAERVFADRGYHASKMQDVAAGAGISLGTLYTVFPGKDDIFEALHETRGEAFLARIEPALHEAADPRVVLWHSVRGFTEFLLEHPDYFRVDLREGRSWAVGDVESSAAFQKGIAQWTDLIARGIKDGVFRDEDPAMMATTVFGLMQVQLAALLGNGAPTDPATIARRLAESVERQVCRLEILAATPPWEEEAGMPAPGRKRRQNPKRDSSTKRRST